MTYNAFSLAWKITKNKTKTYTFKNALVLAWKILKVSNVTSQNGYFEIKSKIISMLNLFGVDKIRNGIKVRNESYDLNVLFYQLRMI